MDESNYLVEGTAAALDEQLLPAVDVLGIENESDIEKVNELAFELYKEALSFVNLASHILDRDAAGKVVTITPYEYPQRAIRIIGNRATSGPLLDHVVNRGNSDISIFHREVLF